MLCRGLDTIRGIVVIIISSGCTTVGAMAIEHVASVTDRVVCDVPCFADGLVNE